MFDTHYLGHEGTYFGIGVVENRQDPLFLGRVQVRVFEAHTSDLSRIPSAHLPWAVVPSHVLNLKENDRVFIIWADGPDKQIPIVMAKLEGFNAVPPFTGAGFGDQRQASDLKTAPRKPTSIKYNTDGSGAVIADPSQGSLYPTQKELNLQSLTGATRYDYANTVIQYRLNNIDKGVLTANGIKWTEPSPAYNALYPYNHAQESESGHLIEVDDTPGCERLSLYHRSGSFYEYYPTGTKVEKVVKSNYAITMGDDYVHIMGRAFVTVGENCYIKVQGDANMEVTGNFNVSSGGDMNFTSAGDVQIVGGTVDIIGRVDASINGTAEVDIVGGAVYVSATNDLELGVENGMVSAGPLFAGNTSVTLADIKNPTLAPTVTTAPNLGHPAPELPPVPFPGQTYTPNPFVALAVKNSQYLVDSPASTITSGPLAGKAPPDATVTPNDSCDFHPSQGTGPQNDSAHTYINVANFSLSTQGAVFIQKHEAIGGKPNLQAYHGPTDPPGLLTIGYGTTNAVLPVSEQINASTTITADQAAQYLNDAINNIFLPALKQCITVPMTQNMIDACLSFMYNVGPGNFASSSVCKFINQQRWCAAANAFKAWIYSNGKPNPGLINRRNDEYKLFQS